MKRGRKLKGELSNDVLLNVTLTEDIINKLKDSYTSVPDILRSVVNTAITEDIPERIYSKVYAIIGQEDIANQGKVRIVYLGEIS